MNLNEIINTISEYIITENILYIQDDCIFGVAPNGAKSRLSNNMWNYVRSPVFIAENGDWIEGFSDIITDENSEPALFKQIDENVYARVYDYNIPDIGFVRNKNSRTIPISVCEEYIDQGLTESYDILYLNESKFVPLSNGHATCSSLVKDEFMYDHSSLVSIIFKDLQLSDRNSILFEALRGEIINPEELRDLLRNKTVFFQYKKKKTGQVRRARGTLNLNKVPVYQHPIGVNPSNPEKVVTYYDFDRRDWRSVSKNPDQLIILSGRTKREPKVFITDKPKDGDVKVVNTPDGADKIHIIDKDQPTVSLTGEVPQEGPSEPIVDVPNGRPDTISTSKTKPEQSEPSEPSEPEPSELGPSEPEPSKPEQKIKPTKFDLPKKEQKKFIRQKKAENNDQLSLFSDYDYNTGAIKTNKTIKKIDKTITPTELENTTDTQPTVNIKEVPNVGNVVKANKVIKKRI